MPPARCVTFRRFEQGILNLKIVFIFIATLLAVPMWFSPASAEEPRKVDFTTILLDADNEAITVCVDNPTPLDDRDCKARRPLTLGMVSMRALSAPEQGLAPEESLKRGQLAFNVYTSKAAQLTVDELAMIKRLIARAYGPIIVARAFPLLDPASTK